jgi:hypothetical protein
MKNTRPALPRLGTPLVGIIIDSINIGQMKQRRNSRLLVALAAQKLAGRAGQDDANGQRALVFGQGLDDFGDCGPLSVLCSR